jgi:hypothetical protein
MSFRHAQWGAGNWSFFAKVTKGLRKRDSPDALLALDEALTRVAAVEPQAAKLVHFRYCAGQTMSACADLLRFSLRSARRLWAYAKAWLLQELERD